MAKKVNIKELARRYTTAVFDLAKSEGKLERITSDLQAVAQLLQAEPRLKKLLGAKNINVNEQMSLIKAAAKGFDPLTLNFLMVVTRNGRLHNLSDIIEAFEDQVAESKGEIKAQITTAQELSDKQLKDIAKDLSSKTGKTVKITQNVRPEIIGGLIIKIGAKMFDYSVKSRLTRLKNKLKEAA